jgi:hypothetical protein
MSVIQFVGNKAEHEGDMVNAIIKAFEDAENTTVKEIGFGRENEPNGQVKYTLIFWT